MIHEKVVTFDNQGYPGPTTDANVNGDETMFRVHVRVRCVVRVSLGSAALRRVERCATTGRETHPTRLEATQCRSALWQPQLVLAKYLRHHGRVADSGRVHSGQSGLLSPRRSDKRRICS